MGRRVIVHVLGKRCLILTAKLKEKRKTKTKVSGCSEKGHADNWCDAEDRVATPEGRS